MWTLDPRPCYLMRCSCAAARQGSCFPPVATVQKSLTPLVLQMADRVCATFKATPHLGSAPTEVKLRVFSNTSAEQVLPFLRSVFGYPLDTVVTLKEPDGGPALLADSLWQYCCEDGSSGIIEVTWHTAPPPPPGFLATPAAAQPVNTAFTGCLTCGSTSPANGSTQAHASRRLPYADAVRLAVTRLLGTGAF
jgi:hypothetical protein